MTRRSSAFVAIVVVVAAGLLVWRSRPPRVVAPPHVDASIKTLDVVLRVPHVPVGSITIDGETDDRGWLEPPGPARTGPFHLANGAVAKPYSEARLVWEDGNLFITLYAADEDIRTRTDKPDGPLWLDDSFRITLLRDHIEYAIEVSPTGIVADGIRADGGAFDYTWSSGVRVAHDTDGTVNDATDDDEEWVIELAIPFASIGMMGKPGETIGFSLGRCDTPKGADHTQRVCEEWGAVERPAQIVLE